MAELLPPSRPVPAAPAAGDTGPWNLAELWQTGSSRLERGGTREVREGDRRVRLSRVYYPGEPFLDRPTRVFAWYARPADPSERRVPGIALIHGGGGTASAEWARLWAARGYAALAMDLYGQGPDRRRLPDGGPDWSDHAVAWRFARGVSNSWLYHATAAVVRGISFLASRAEVDPNRLAVTGVSWGGYFACMAMSLDDRLKAAVPVYGSGFNPGMGTGPDSTDEQRRTVRENFAAERYLPRCRVPALWVTGTQEPYATPEAVQHSARATAGPRTLCITPRPSHVDPQLCDRGWERMEIHLFTDALFRGTPGLPRLQPPVIEAGHVRAACSAPLPLDVTALHWTSDLDNPSPQRRWQSTFAAVDEAGRLDAPLPAARPALLFFTAMDSRGALVSSELVTCR